MLLWFLQLHPDGVARRGLGKLIGRHRDSVAKAILVLSSAGLVEDCDGQVRLICSDVIAGLDSWCSAMGISGRLLARKQEHQAQRLDRRELKLWRDSQRNTC